MKKIVLSVALCLSIAPIVSDETKKEISPETVARIARFSFNVMFGIMGGIYYEDAYDNKPSTPHISREIPIVVAGEVANQAMYHFVFAPNNQKYTVIKPHHQDDFLARGLARAVIAAGAPSVREKNNKNPHFNKYNLINSDLVIAGVGIIGSQLLKWYKGKPQETEKQEQRELIFSYQKQEGIKDSINPNPQPKKENINPVKPVMPVPTQQTYKTPNDAEREERDFLLLSDLT